MTANRIVQHIFQQPDIKLVDESALERLVSSYPYFTAARLLLARKQYTIHKNLLSPAVKKAQQYSNNMHYFYRFVTTDEKSLAVVEEAPVVPAAVAPEETPVFSVEESAPVAEPVQTPVNEPVAAFEAPAPLPVPEAPAAVATVAEIPEPEAITTQQPTPEPPAFIPEAPVTAATIAASPAAPPVEDTPAEEEEADISAWDEPVTTPAEEEEKEEEEEAITVTANEVQTAPVEETPAIAPLAEAPVVHVEAVPSAPAPATIKIFPLDTSAPEDNSLTFQPLYSDDYFAYKRLKDPEHAETLNEKGAAEMKSFTSWLREMKTTFAEKASKKWYQEQMNRSYEDANPEVSEAVEKMAMESITLNNDIVSETLAEIWARQQKYQTAIHIYQKLSLLNPNKSAYFAQKIKELQLLTEKS
ncbi:hypothetical protein [Chitinophaga rhizophila]|uniref:Uncharacterized protein n=1 Tax=Chitinophaga rhizophila TaxID=2866212 RepID=A0ABS7G6F0_9BACT|nr:hypothetical protein [Chitinophaga rhizophila]MBW8683230.1 hypothetical protein [Chitinophaga rhizophila]